jgi:hypothetical protein
MHMSWETESLTSANEVLDKLVELKGRAWQCRGQPMSFGGLVPSIDRGGLRSATRSEKLLMERRSIELLRSTARFFADPGESAALADDVIALMVLRHHGVPTRLLDWTMSPWVAAFFASDDSVPCAAENGEIWAFDQRSYANAGKEQWRNWPETTFDRSGDPGQFSAGLTAFTVEKPPDWIISAFYPGGFPRQHAQQGAYTMTARFGRDHSCLMATVLNDSSRYRRFVFDAAIKRELRDTLRRDYGIWRGTLFPDTAGAAETAASAFSRVSSDRDEPDPPLCTEP